MCFWGFTSPSGANRAACRRLSKSIRVNAGGAINPPHGPHQHYPRRLLPLGSIAYEPELNERGEHLVWLETRVVDRLRAMRGPRESYSDVILQLVEAERGRNR